MEALTVGKLLEILEQYDSNSLIRVYDSVFKEVSDISKIETKYFTRDLPDVVLTIRED